MAEEEVNKLRRAVRQQSLVIKQLTAELEEERKASASGADEALAMIMRLREAKATENMEASHFKMFAEEQLHNAEEALTFLNEMILKKEMENAFLKYQLQEYKQKLFGLGFRDTVEQPNLISSFRKRKLARNVTLPPIRLEELISETNKTDDGHDLSPNEHSFFAERGNSTANQLHNEYDEIKVFGQSDNSVSLQSERKKSSLMQPQECSEKKYISTDEFQTNSTGSMRMNGQGPVILPSHCRDGRKGHSFVLKSTSSSQSRLEGDAFCSVSIQEMYAVQENDNGYSFRRTSQTLKEPVHLTTFPIIKEDEISASSIDEHDELVYKKWEEASLYSYSSTEQHEVQPAKYQADLEKLKKWMEHLEDDMITMKQEELKRGSDQLKLLSGITKQLDSIRLHIGSRKPKEHLHDDSYLMTYLAEAMHSFWI